MREQSRGGGGGDRHTEKDRCAHRRERGREGENHSPECFCGAF